MYILLTIFNMYLYINPYQFRICVCTNAIIFSIINYHMCTYKLSFVYIYKDEIRSRILLNYEMIMIIP